MVLSGASSLRLLSHLDDLGWLRSDVVLMKLVNWEPWYNIGRPVCPAGLAPCWLSIAVLREDLI